MVLVPHAENFAFKHMRPFSNIPEVSPFRGTASSSPGGKLRYYALAYELLANPWCVLRDAYGGCVCNLDNC